MKERLDQLSQDPIWGMTSWGARNLRALGQEVQADLWSDDHLSRALDIFEALAFTLTNMVEASAAPSAAERSVALGALMASYMNLYIERA